MKALKKIVCAFFAASLILFCAACGGESSEQDIGNDLGADITEKDLTEHEEKAADFEFMVDEESVIDDSKIADEVKGDNPELIAYIESEDATAFVSTMKEKFEKTFVGLTCDCKLVVTGNVLGIVYYINDTDDMPSDQKSKIQAHYDETIGLLAESFASVKKTVPSISEVEIRVCETDGDNVAFVEFALG